MAGEIKDKLLCVTTEQAAYDRALVRPALEALIDTVEQFAQAFADEKRRRSLADFNDLEHFAVRLLYKDGKPSLLADRLAASFCEILVDEYQDTNGVQDAIFSAIARDNLFMVAMSSSLSTDSAWQIPIFSWKSTAHLLMSRSMDRGGVWSCPKISAHAPRCWIRSTIFSARL